MIPGSTNLSVTVSGGNIEAEWTEPGPFLQTWGPFQLPQTLGELRAIIETDGQTGFNYAGTAGDSTPASVLVNGVYAGTQTTPPVATILGLY